MQMFKKIHWETSQVRERKWSADELEFNGPVNTIKVKSGRSVLSNHTFPGQDLSS